MHYVHDMVTVTDEALLRTIKFFWERMKLLIEPTGALGTAALLEHVRLFRILYAGFAGLNEFSELSALSYSPKMFAINICIQNPIEPHVIYEPNTRIGVIISGGNVDINRMSSLIKGLN